LIRKFRKTHVIVKTKLTLTVNKSVIEAAKRKAKSRGISLSQMFESMDSNQTKAEPKRAAERLINRLEKYESISQLEDKKLIKEYVKGKFA
jgi:hypothetical protein